VREFRLICADAFSSRALQCKTVLPWRHEAVDARVRGCSREPGEAPARRPLSRRRPYSSFLRLVNPPRKPSQLSCRWRFASVACGPRGARRAISTSQTWTLLGAHGAEFFRWRFVARLHSLVPSTRKKVAARRTPAQDQVRGRLYDPDRGGTPLALPALIAMAMRSGGLAVVPESSALGHNGGQVGACVQRGPAREANCGCLAACARRCSDFGFTDCLLV
jgi:hypothetical protein